MIWTDVHLSPALAQWIAAEFGHSAIAIRDLGLRVADDEIIFEAARKANAIVMTKDVDFINLLERYGPPPQVIWLTCGNTSNAFLRDLLRKTLPQVLELFQHGEALVEISGP